MTAHNPWSLFRRCLVSAADLPLDQRIAVQVEALKAISNHYGQRLETLEARDRDISAFHVKVIGQALVQRQDAANEKFSAHLEHVEAHSHETRKTVDCLEDQFHNHRVDLIAHQRQLSDLQAQVETLRGNNGSHLADILAAIEAQATAISRTNSRIDSILKALRGASDEATS